VRSSSLRFFSFFFGGFFPRSVLFLRSEVFFLAGPFRRLGLAFQVAPSRPPHSPQHLPPLAWKSFYHTPAGRISFLVVLSSFPFFRRPFFPSLFFFWSPPPYDLPLCFTPGGLSCLLPLPLFSTGEALPAKTIRWLFFRLGTLFFSVAPFFRWFFPRALSASLSQRRRLSRLGPTDRWSRSKRPPLSSRLPSPPPLFSTDSRACRRY